MFQYNEDVQMFLSTQIKRTKQKHCKMWVLLYVGNGSLQGWQVRPLSVYEILVLCFCTLMPLTNDTVYTAHLARNEMFKVTRVQMSQCVGEYLRKTVTLLRLLVPFLELQFITIGWKNSCFVWW